MEPLVFGTLASRLPRIGGMATMPSRRASLLQALPHILPQLDRLFLYLDKHTEVPAELAGFAHITPLLPNAADGTLGGSGKFMALHQGIGPCLFLGFDDDIIYGPTYVAHLTAALRRYRYACLVGLHGAVLQRHTAGYVASKAVTNFADDLLYDIAVDELGTGTLALHSSLLPLDPRRWANHGMADLMVALSAIRRGVPRMAVQRPVGLARPIAVNQPDSLYVRAKANDRVQTALLNAARECYPDAWCRSA